MQWLRSECVCVWMCLFAPVRAGGWIQIWLFHRFCQPNTHIHKHWNYLHVVLKIAYTVILSFYLSTQVYLAMRSPNIYFTSNSKWKQIDSNDSFGCWMRLCHGNKKKMCKYLEWTERSGYHSPYVYASIQTTTATCYDGRTNNWNGVHQAHLFAVTTIQMADHHKRKRRVNRRVSVSILNGLSLLALFFISCNLNRSLTRPRSRAEPAILSVNHWWPILIS